MKTDIIPCVCCDHERNCGDDVYYGMPQLQVTDKMKYFTAYCPNCGRGGSFQYKSAYLAIKDWNKMQKCLRKNEIFEAGEQE
ncbi:hypothetical protein D1155_10050 [Anaerotruncus sp. 80]|uniref:Restriction alleviation protein, Lar family n=1 Tax=Anaerotruncus colihominis TaxID=169435 RepID=A0A845QLP9_9FIRM|nr:hypothetical protein [Anaerotruncus colihominis]NCF02646.1 hypothetical protein [Anaerotruncus sp. 80]